MKTHLKSVLCAALVSVAFASLSADDGLLTGKGFVTGCNYWASHAGLRMWRDWDGAQVEKDLVALGSG